MTEPKNVLAHLDELRALTGDAEGAQRLAWSPVWLQARAWFAEKLAELPVEHHYDAAGNHWVTLAGDSEKALVLGSHLDSVPNGGWLDGCLGVMAGLEVLTSFAREYNGRPPCTVRLVDWADEEGARFGRSLFGSSAFAGTHSIEADRVRADREGTTLESALRECGYAVDKVGEACAERKNLAAYRGQEAHSGSTPMEVRRDALAAAAKLALEIRPIARKHPQAVATMGSVKTFPGIVTAVVGRCETTLDMRDLDAGVLASMLREAREASERFAREESCTVEWAKIWSIEPIPFHPELIELCEQAVIETVGTSERLPSGPLHDAAEVARLGIPTVMMFVQSLNGLSHNRAEDTDREHLEQAVRALHTLAVKTMDWILRG